MNKPIPRKRAREPQAEGLCCSFYSPTGSTLAFGSPSVRSCWGDGGHGQGSSLKAERLAPKQGDRKQMWASSHSALGSTSYTPVLHRVRCTQEGLTGLCAVGLSIRSAPATCSQEDQMMGRAMCTLPLGSCLSFLTLLAVRGSD